MRTEGLGDGKRACPVGAVPRIAAESLYGVAVGRRG